jgi:hypothetical protein
MILRGRREAGREGGSGGSETFGIGCYSQAAMGAGCARSGVLLGSFLYRALAQHEWNALYDSIVVHQIE